jgi:hypothetical protein
MAITNLAASSRQCTENAAAIQWHAYLVVSVVQLCMQLLYLELPCRIDIPLEPSSFHSVHMGDQHDTSDSTQDVLQQLCHRQQCSAAETPASEQDAEAHGRKLSDARLIYHSESSDGQE